MTNTNSHIISIYNARKNLLEILEERGFDVTPYSNFSINEISIMLETNQLDELMEFLYENLNENIEKYVFLNIRKRWPEGFLIVENKKQIVK